MESTGEITELLEKLKGEHDSEEMPKSISQRPYVCKKGLVSTIFEASRLPSLTVYQYRKTKAFSA